MSERDHLATLFWAFRMQELTQREKTQLLGRRPNLEEGEGR